MKMKINRSLMIFTLLMVFIISLGMVSASEDTQEITEITDDIDEVVSIDDEPVLEESDETEIVSDNTPSASDFNVQIVEGDHVISSDDTIISFDKPEDVTGYIQVTVEKKGDTNSYGTNHYFDLEEQKTINLESLNIYQIGTYNLNIKYSYSENEIQLATGTINVILPFTASDFNVQITDETQSLSSETPIISFNKPEGANGYILIDVKKEGDKNNYGTTYYLEDLEDQTEFYLNSMSINKIGDYKLKSLGINKIGEYKINITYRDYTYYSNEIQLATGTLNVILTKDDFDVIIYPDVEEFVATIHHPSEIDGSIYINVDGNKVYEKDQTNSGWLEIILSDLNIDEIGDYNITIIVNC